MQKLKPRAISYDRFLFILSTINPNNNPTIDIGIRNSLVPKIIATIGVSSYTISPNVAGSSIASTIQQSLQHITKYSIHSI